MDPEEAKQIAKGIVEALSDAGYQIVLARKDRSGMVCVAWAEVGQKVAIRPAQIFPPPASNIATAVGRLRWSGRS